MIVLHSSLYSVPSLTMLSLLLSRGFCQAVTEVNRRSYPTVASFIRTFTTPSPTCGHDDEASLVTPSQLKAMLSNRNVQLFDVRNPDEYQDGHIPQAVNLPLGIVEESLKLPPESFKQKFEVKAPGKDDDNIVFNCRTGVRSGEALGIARQMGFHRARHLKGGYAAWVEQEGN
ncbi:thiosulfate sulfurtransferase/rhodanese-like domain-containing protein 1 [Poecilia latipinna]|uniref:Thiosulfate sulfurtransferase/rhodanese-like domain-containing protein 1 n=2 Tax=Poecilia TaxID=8080 RepID=A0A087XW73_POEFO|nr:PREDICTED: thiosulfate sulfurtransferase/rhodanese-like domain-containing protein 1 [Poecilia formosa]XP_014883248.1 PREDICTED: thiosulfate sulfurtransferase/rhodanese-like domain-containing protein 1 [Poecilia latipinna]